jgi:UDPglucose--hexose-1-phosphate uridylyltransferase
MSSRNQLRLDPLTGRWVAVSIDRSMRPSQFRTPRPAPTSAEGEACPFCPSSMDRSYLIAAFGNGGGRVYVFKNRFPAFEGDQEFVVNTLGPVFTEAPSSGMHEVLVLSEDHGRDWGLLKDEELRSVVEAITERVKEHGKTKGIRYSQVLVNEGAEAGASIRHPHAQILGLPFVPREVGDEQGGFERFKGGCVVCTTAKVEETVRYRVVLESREALALCPFWSAVPYELMVIPRHHSPHMHEADSDTLVAVAVMIRDLVVAIRKVIGELSYNIIFHSAPFRPLTAFHWHVHLLPKLTTRAGFELGTGVPINVLAPEQAAEDLRSAVPPF